MHRGFPFKISHPPHCDSSLQVQRRQEENGAGRREESSGSHFVLSRKGRTKMTQLGRRCENGPPNSAHGFDQSPSCLHRSLSHTHSLQMILIEHGMGRWRCPLLLRFRPLQALRSRCISTGRSRMCQLVGAAGPPARCLRRSWEPKWCRRGIAVGGAPESALQGRPRRRMTLPPHRLW